MIFPQIGTTIDVEYGKQLCIYYGMLHIAERINKYPNLYKSWIFVGLNDIGDNFISKIIECHNENILYQCILPHTLSYAYGEINNYSERATADKKLKEKLTNIQLSPGNVMLIYFVVRLLGSEIFDFSWTWGFANKSRNVMKININA